MTLTANPQKNEFSFSPEDLQNAIALSNKLHQWQAGQLKKLHAQLIARCSQDMGLQWHINEAQPYKPQSHFSLAFPGYEGLTLRVEWFWGFAAESELYWGLYAPEIGVEQARELGAKMMSALGLSRLPAPPAEVDANWPLWTFVSSDPLFTPAGSEDHTGVTQPWLTIDGEHGLNFVTLVLMRYEQVRAALGQL